MYDGGNGRGRWRGMGTAWRTSMQDDPTVCFSRVCQTVIHSVHPGILLVGHLLVIACLHPTPCPLSSSSLYTVCIYTSCARWPPVLLSLTLTFAGLLFWHFLPILIRKACTKVSLIKNRNNNHQKHPCCEDTFQNVWVLRFFSSVLIL